MVSKHNDKEYVNDLVKRLRTMAGTGWNPIGDEAADIIQAQAVDVCAWVENDDGFYSTGCGHQFEFIDGGPDDTAEEVRGGIEVDHIIACLIGTTSAAPTPVPAAQPEQDVCRIALEEACIVSWVSADLSTIEGAKKAIAELCAFEVQLATDPATNGGKVLVPAAQPVADAFTWPSCDCTITRYSCSERLAAQQQKDGE